MQESISAMRYRQKELWPRELRVQMHYQLAVRAAVVALDAFIQVTSFFMFTL